MTSKNPEASRDHQQDSKSLQELPASIQQHGPGTSAWFLLGGGTPSFGDSFPGGGGHCHALLRLFEWVGDVAIGGVDVAQNDRCEDITTLIGKFCQYFSR